MFQYADNCTEALMLSRTAFFSLYDQYKALETEAKDQREKANTEELAKNKALEEVEKQTNRKIIWRRVAIGEGIVIVGVTVAVVTGAWLPALAATGVVEVIHLTRTKPDKPFKPVEEIKEE